MEKQNTIKTTLIINPMTLSNVTRTRESGGKLSYSPLPSPVQLPKKTHSWWSIIKRRLLKTPFS